MANIVFILQLNIFLFLAEPFIDFDLLLAKNLFERRNSHVPPSLTLEGSKYQTRGVTISDEQINIVGSNKNAALALVSHEATSIFSFDNSSVRITCTRLICSSGDRVADLVHSTFACLSVILDSTFVSNTPFLVSDSVLTLSQTSLSYSSSSKFTGFVTFTNKGGDASLMDTCLDSLDVTGSTPLIGGFYCNNAIVEKCTITNISHSAALRHTLDINAPSTQRACLISNHIDNTENALYGCVSDGLFSENLISHNNTYSHARNLRVNVLSEGQTYTTRVTRSVSDAFVNDTFENIAVDNHGAALYVHMGNTSAIVIVINQCFFYNNTAGASSDTSYDGGAIFTTSNSITLQILQTNFTYCTATRDGGAICLCGSYIIDDCIFSHCNANGTPGCGGAVKQYAGYGIPLIKDCRFESCDCPLGIAGAVYIESNDASLTLYNSVFTECTAYQTAGAIFVNATPTSDSYVNFTSLSFEGSEATEKSSSGWRGNDIFFTEDCDNHDFIIIDSSDSSSNSPQIAVEGRATFFVSNFSAMYSITPRGLSTTAIAISVVAVIFACIVACISVYFCHMFKVCCFSPEPFVSSTGFISVHAAPESVYSRPSNNEEQQPDPGESKTLIHN